MMKKIIFLNTNFGYGGINSSMVNTANHLSNFCDVSIFCYLPEGPMKGKLLPNIHILEPSWRYKAICMTIGEAKKRGTKYFFFKIFAKVWSLLFDNRFPLWIARRQQDDLGYFDVACSFSHEGSIHYECSGLIRVVLDKIKSPFKTSWVHCDFNYLKESRINNKYYNRIDAIVGVTESVANAFRKGNPNIKTQIISCPNMLDYEGILEQAKEESGIVKNENTRICFSACRLSDVKGIGRAINAFASTLLNNNVIWYIAGDGPEKNNIISAIHKYKLEDKIILLGSQNNPFKFMVDADLYISSSYQEAAPMVYAEAKALHIPVFTTRTLSAEEMLDERIDYICENNENDMATSFESIIRDVNNLSYRKQLLIDFAANNNKAIQIYKQWLKEEID